VASEEFVAAVQNAAFDSAVKGTTTRLKDGPAGRRPQPRATALGHWFNQLRGADQQMVVECVRDAAHAAVFGFLCILDGVRVIDDPPHAELRLTATGERGITSTLASSSEPFELHDEFNGLVHPASEPWPPRQDPSASHLG
jgi:hypothetical protein